MTDAEKVIDGLGRVKHKYISDSVTCMWIDEAIQTIRELQTDLKYDLDLIKVMNREIVTLVEESLQSKSEEVCEWKYPSFLFEDGNEVFEVECNKNPLKHKSIPNNFSFTDFKYCPYCGRKIKVVK